MGYSFRSFPSVADLMLNHFFLSFLIHMTRLGCCDITVISWVFSWPGSLVAGNLLSVFILDDLQLLEDRNPGDGVLIGIK